MNGIDARERIYSDMRRGFESCGYKPFSMRRFEEYSLYADNLNFLKSKQIITFTDTAGRLLALKPDVTLSIVKSAKASKESSEKLYYRESVYRPDKLGEYREHDQIGIECIGAIDMPNIIEITELALRSLAAIDGAYTLELSDMGIVTELLGFYNAGDGASADIIEQVRKKSCDGIESAVAAYGLDSALSERLCALVGCSAGYKGALDALTAAAVTDGMKDIAKKLSDIYDAFKNTEYEDKLRIEFSALNDISYYNGLIMQGYVAGAARAVLFGGQYDKLLKKFGKDMSAMGFAVYLDELMFAESAAEVDVFITYGSATPLSEVVGLSRKLRAEGKSVRVDAAEPTGLKYGKKITL